MSRAKRLLAAALLALAGLLAFVYARPVSALEALGELVLRLQGVRSREVQAGSYRLRYLEAGSGPPLVLVHGLGSHAMQDWGRLVAPLARRYHVYAPDLPGFGRSERPASADYSIPMQVEAVRGFMAALGVTRARVAGISMGGWIVARLAAERPELVERLVVVAPAGLRPDASAPIPVEVLFPQDEDGVRRLIAAVRHKPPVAPAFVLRDIARRKLRDEWIVRRTLESMRPGRDWVNGALGGARMPVLIVWGRQDALVPVAYAAPFQAEFANARLELLHDCGHVPMADCPEAFDPLLEAFLAAP
ncbi:MAG: alpha/beta fold hydrolase [Vicinamibacterales bacterium]